MNIYRLIILFSLSVFCGQSSWAVSSLSEFYLYDANTEYSGVRSQQNLDYDDVSNLRYCCSDFLNNNFQEKTQSGPFFAFEVGLFAAKGRGQQLGSIIKTDGSTKASEIKAKAESLDFKPSQSANGPLKLVDENGVARATIKGGSQRTPGGAGPHVELKTSSGQRVNPAGASVTRKS